MDGLRKFTEVDNHEAVKVGGLSQDIKFFKVAMPKFTTDFRGAVIREGADELTLQANRVCTAHLQVEDQTLVDADW